MTSEFLKQGIKITKVFHCPHHPEFTGPCFCRKPSPGMFLQAQKEFNIDLTHSIMVGDSNTDIEAATNAGIENSYLISTGQKILENKFNVEILHNLKQLIHRTF